MTTYCEDLSIALEDEMFEAYRQDFFRCMDEVEYLAEGYARGFIAMEDVTIDNDKNKTGTFQSVLDFIKRVIAKFMDACKRIVQSDSKWFDANVHQFDKIPDSVYGSMKITCVPYWKMSKYTLPNLTMGSNDSKLGSDGYKTAEDLGKKMYPELVKLTVSGKVAEGAKIYFRGGSNNVVEMSGNNVKATVTNMINYCRDYAGVCDGIRQQVERVEKDIEKAEADAEKVANSNASDYKTDNSAKTTTKENYILCENAVLENSTIAYVPFINTGSIVTEADQPNKTDKPTDTKPADTNGTVSVAGDNKDAGQNNGEQKNVTPSKAQLDAKDKKYSNASAVKSYYQVQLQVATAMMTIAEERHNAYMRTLRDVLSAGLNTSNNAENKKA